MSASTSQRLETFCTLACGLPDPTNATSSTELGERTPEILDALASVAVCEKKGHVVAVGATIVPGHITLYVAENHSVLQKVIDHLRDIVARLKALRSYGQNVSGSPPNVQSFVNNDFVTKQLEELESQMIAYAWLKLRQRFYKRYDRFKKLMRFVLHNEGNVHAEADTEFRQRLLVDLRRPDVLTDLDKVEMLLHNMDIGFQDAATSNKRVGIVRMTMQSLRAIHVKSAADGLKLFELCTLYFDCQEKGFDLDRWMGKITTPRVHFLCLARLVTSNTLASFIDANIKVVSVEPQLPASISVDITREMIREVAQVAGWNPDEARDSKGELIGDAVLDQFLLNLANNVTERRYFERVPIPTKIQRNFTEVYPHCECTLLAYLDGKKGLHQYIGVSKLSCALCSECFAAYSKQARLQMTTRGSHSQVVTPWACPFPEISVVRQKMEEAILGKIHEGLQALELAEKRARQLSQSTVASDDIPEKENLKLIQAIMELAKEIKNGDV